MNIQDKLAFSIVQLFIHLMVIYYYLQSKLVQLFPANWSTQFIITVLILFVLSLLMIIIPWQNIRKALYFVRMLFFMMIAVPFAENPGNFSLLYTLQTFDSFFYFNKKTAFGICAFYIIFSLWLANKEILLWDFYVAKHSEKLLAFFVIALHCIVGGTIGYWLAKEQQQRVKEKKLFEELQNSNRYLAEANIGLQNVAAQAELASVFKERTRIAREIHDSIAYTFTNLIALLNAYLIQAQSVGEAPIQIEKARNLAIEGLSELRQALRTLRPSENETQNGLGSILRITKVFAQATGIRIEVNFGDVSQFLGEKVEAVIYRVVQEGLTNSFRHGKATEVFVSFYKVGDGVEVNIKDNGVGTTTTTGGFGLLGINERVTELGGWVETYSKPGNGFTLRIWLPLEKGE